MTPPSKRQKRGQLDVEEAPLTSVLEWFDTTKKPSTILCRSEESAVDSNAYKVMNIENYGVHAGLFEEWKRRILLHMRISGNWKVPSRESLTIVPQEG